MTKVIYESRKPEMVFKQRTGPFILNKHTGRTTDVGAGHYQFEFSNARYRTFEAERTELSDSLVKLLQLKQSHAESGFKNPDFFTVGEERPRSSFNGVGKQLTAKKYWLDINAVVTSPLLCAVMGGDIHSAVKLISQPDENKSCDVFRTEWTLSNSYDFSAFEDGGLWYSSNYSASLVDASLVAGEKMLLTSLHPIVLAMLTRQTSMTIALLKAVPSFNIHEKIAPSNKSFFQIAETLKLENLVSHLTKTDPALLRKKQLTESGKRYKNLKGFFAVKKEGKDSMRDLVEDETATYSGAVVVR